MCGIWGPPFEYTMSTRSPEIITDKKYIVVRRGKPQDHSVPEVPWTLEECDLQQTILAAYELERASCRGDIKYNRNERGEFVQLRGAADYDEIKITPKVCYEDADHCATPEVTSLSRLPFLERHAPSNARIMPMASGL
jgi:hypothetical protein